MGFNPSQPIQLAKARFDHWAGFTKIHLTRVFAFQHGHDFPHVTQAICVNLSYRNIDGRLGLSRGQLTRQKVFNHLAVQ